MIASALISPIHSMYLSVKVGRSEGGREPWHTFCILARCTYRVRSCNRVHDSAHLLSSQGRGAGFNSRLTLTGLFMCRADDAQSSDEDESDGDDSGAESASGRGSAGDGSGDGRGLEAPSPILAAASNGTTGSRGAPGTGRPAPQAEQMQFTG